MPFGHNLFNNVPYGDRIYRYWVPLIGLYTGARINEISQLYLDDIDLDNE